MTIIRENVNYKRAEWNREKLFPFVVVFRPIVLIQETGLCNNNGCINVSMGKMCLKLTCIFKTKATKAVIKLAVPTKRWRS